MKKILDLKFLRSIKTGKGLIKLIKNLREHRKVNKIMGVKRSALTKSQRSSILTKTDGRCHICGIELEPDNFQADHVRSHSVGGAHAENNYLASCSLCNNYRWHYSPEEIQIILKLGVWIKTKVTSDDPMGLEIANAFVKYEMALRKRKAIQQQKMVAK